MHITLTRGKERPPRVGLYRTLQTFNSINPSNYHRLKRPVTALDVFTSTMFLHSYIASSVKNALGTFELIGKDMISGVGSLSKYVHAYTSSVYEDDVFKHTTYHYRDGTLTSMCITGTDRDKRPLGYISEFHSNVNHVYIKDWSTQIYNAVKLSLYNLDKDSSDNGEPSIPFNKTLYK